MPTERPTLAEEDEYYRILWYSDPGKGKTTAIATAAKFGKVVYVDSENGLKAKALRKFGIPVENIEPRREIGYEALKALHQELLHRLADGEDIFAVVIDTTTKAQGSLINQAVDEQVEKAAAIGKERSELDTFQEDYGRVAVMMRRLIRSFHDLPCHVLLGAHQRRDIDEDGAVRVGPALTPAVATDVSGYMDCVIHIRTEDFGGDIEYSGLTAPRGRFTAKDRYNLLPPVLVDPTFERVYGYLEETLTRDSDPSQKAARARRQTKKQENTDAPSE